MEVVFCTLLNNGFVPGAEVFFKSLKNHNPSFDYKFLILNNQLKTSNKKKLKRCYPNIEFLPFDRDSYNFPIDKTIERLLSTYYKLEIFRIATQTSYDRLIFMDMDILIMGSLDGLIFSELQGNPIGGCKQFVPKNDKVINDINSGVLVLDCDKIEIEDYQKMIKMVEEGFELPDQEIINLHYVRNGKCTYLPKIYNIEKRMIKSKKYKQEFNNAVCIHFVARKPWESKGGGEKTFGPIYKKWRAYSK